MHHFESIPSLGTAIVVLKYSKECARWNNDQYLCSVAIELIVKKCNDGQELENYHDARVANNNFDFVVFDQDCRIGEHHNCSNKHSVAWCSLTKVEKYTRHCLIRRILN